MKGHCQWGSQRLQQGIINRVSMSKIYQNILTTLYDDGIYMMIKYILLEDLGTMRPPF